MKELDLHKLYYMKNKPFYQSKTIWGLTLAGIIPAISTILGIDVTTGLDILREIYQGTTTHYTFIQWLEIVSQSIGYILTIYGTLNKNRSPLTIK